MKLSTLFGRDRPTSIARPSAQDQAERLLVESFRLLGQVCAKVADYLEAQRLARGGYDRPGEFLERLDHPGLEPKGPPETPEAP